MSRAVKFLKSNEGFRGDCDIPRTPFKNLEDTLQSGCMIPFDEIPSMIGANPSVTAVLVNHLISSGYASVVTRIDRVGRFLVKNTKYGTNLTASPL